MERIQSYEALAATVDGLLKQKTCGNFVPDRESLEREIAAGQLWAQTLPEGLLLLRRTPDLQRLRFLLTDPAPLLRLRPERTTALELPCRSGDVRVHALTDALVNAGWTLALRRVRLSRRAAPVAEQISFPHGEADVGALDGLLRACFSPLTGCLPEKEELAEELASGRLLYGDGALLRWREKGRVSEIRHLAVRPERRGCGHAKELVSAYLAREGDKLCRVWTGEENAAARHVYESFGFTPDGWTSAVLIIKP